MGDRERSAGTDGRWRSQEPSSLPADCRLPLAHCLPSLRAVLLVGGQGTRLRPLTYSVPKHLAPVANRPLIYYPLECLRRGGVREVTLACGYKADQLRDGMARVGVRDLAIRFVEEDTPLGTAGAVRQGAEGYDETFIAMNGDQIVDVDVPALLAAHRERGAALTIVVRRVPDISAYGLVVCDDDLRIRGFVEKVSRDETGRNLINSGVYVLEPHLVERIPAGVAYSNEYELFPDVVSSGEPVYAYPLPEAAYWADVGRPENYLAANAALLAGALTWAPPPMSEDVAIASEAKLMPPVSLAAGCRIGPGARVGPSVSVGEGAVIGASAVVRDSILWRGAEIGDGAELDQAIVGPGHRVAPGATIHGPAIVADDA